MEPAAFGAKCASAGGIIRRPVFPDSAGGTGSDFLDPINFVKLSGSGNDFICIDNRDGRFSEAIASGQAAELARRLCPRGVSVGADGVIFAEDPDWVPQADVLATFFEPDGSQASLCGNGAACMVYWALMRKWTQNDEVRLGTPAGLVRGRRVDGGLGSPNATGRAWGSLPGQYIRVCIPLPEGMQRDIQLDLDGKTWTVDFLVAGVAHAVTYVDDIEAANVGYVGPMIRRHQRFAPGGANANFVQVIREGEIAVRTFEFGVENETLACGTGSTAAAILAAIRFGWAKKYLDGDEPVRVRARSGDVLRIHFVLKPDGSFDNVCLDTIVRCNFLGTICPELAAEVLGVGVPKGAPKPDVPGLGTPRDTTRLGSPGPDAAAKRSG